MPHSSGRYLSTYHRWQAGRLPQQILPIDRTAVCNPLNAVALLETSQEPNLAKMRALALQKVTTRRLDTASQPKSGPPIVRSVEFAERLSYNIIQSLVPLYINII